MVGDSQVGKTSLLTLYKEERILESPLATVGCDFHIVNKKVEDEDIKLIIWDSAGQEKYRAMTRS